MTDLSTLRDIETLLKDVVGDREKNENPVCEEESVGNGSSDASDLRVLVPIGSWGELRN
jgi:hypothetical protein